MDLPFDVASKFTAECKADPNKSEALAAIKVLKQLLERSDVSTIQGLSSVLNDAIHTMCSADHSTLSVKSTCELFQRFITLRILEVSDDFDSCKSALLHRAQLFIEKVDQCRSRVASHFLALFPDNAHVLLHSHSRVVMAALELIARCRKPSPSSLHFYVTQSLPEGLGRRTTKALANMGLSCSLVADSALAYLMPRVDLVLMGAEAVVESGGVINSIGSASLAMIAQAMHKPVYVLTESFKFTRAYPLGQRQVIPSELLHRRDQHNPIVASEMANLVNEEEDVDSESDPDFPELQSAWVRVVRNRKRQPDFNLPSIDYTDPSYISYLVTDLGVLTPSVVSDELLKLYI